MIKLEIGKWYKSDLTCDYIIRYSENETKEGFFDGGYGDWFFDADSTTREAKDYEVIIAFMKEASQRGHKVYNAYFKRGEMYLSDIEDKVIYSRGVWRS